VSLIIKKLASLMIMVEFQDDISLWLNFSILAKPISILG
jgi:hypothetical protein